MSYVICHRIGDSLKGWDSLECRDNRKIGVMHLFCLLSFVSFSVCFLFVYLVVYAFSSFFFLMGMNTEPHAS